MGIGYQRTDRNCFDYHLWYLDEFDLPLRGPRHYFGGELGICALGAAQTFGRFVERPFVSQLANFFEVSFLNLGFSGAGPQFFLERPRLLKVASQAEVILLQCMSARSVKGPFLEPLPQNNGVLRFVKGPRSGETMMAAPAYQKLWQDYGIDAFREQVESVQSHWQSLNIELIERLKKKVVFLVLANGDLLLDDIVCDGSVGAFPHFVSRRMVEQVSSLCVGHVEAVSTKTFQPLFNDRTRSLEAVFDRKNFRGRPEHVRCVNVYYADQRHHDQIANRCCRFLIDRAILK